MKYTVDHFIDKFEKIPEENWITGTIESEGNSLNKCALGHCGGYSAPESIALDLVFSKANMIHPETRNGLFSIYQLNDDVSNKLGFGTHPKERVLNFLKSQKAVEEANNILKQSLIYEETEVTV